MAQENAKIESKLSYALDGSHQWQSCHLG